MNNIDKILAEANRFKEKRASLAAAYRNIQNGNLANLEQVDSEYMARVNVISQNYEGSRQLIQSRADNEVLGYRTLNARLNAFFQPVSEWCSKSDLSGYVPDPSRVDERELQKLIGMIQEHGVISFFKRTLKLNGYSSRSQMARELCEKILDSKAYCTKCIDTIQSKAKHESEAEMTRKRRNLAEEEERYRQERQKCQDRNEQRLQNVSRQLNQFDNASELTQMRELLKSLLADSEAFCGSWGKYTPPTQMPERIPLCNVAINLPDENGIDRQYAVPYWINLFETNIIVITPDSVTTKKDRNESDELTCRILARLLKTVPPEWVEYTVFDSLRMGSSLDRLVDIINLGTTDLHFSLFTSDESTRTQVGCRERRKYLCDRPAEIIKSIAGRHKTLFSFNREAGKKMEHPFSWIVDFHFHPDSSNKLSEQYSKMLVNASAAGCSFIFVTDDTGAAEIERIAGAYTQTPVLRIDCSKKVCIDKGHSYTLVDYGAPTRDQIGNFTSAVKSYYESGNGTENRIGQVMLQYGINIRDASQGLSIPMALDSRGRIVDLELGGKDSAHGFISGGTNSGKSTLLHTIILSACLHYTPEDLEIWLVDYKQTEFALYRDRPMPHIKMIGLSKTEDFTFSLLDRIEEEGIRRSDLLTHFHAQNLEQYRAHEGEPGYEVLPRLLIIVDEFHEMSQFVSGSQVYRDKLENVLREYRAQGLTFLLADQTFSSGLSGLSIAAKNQIGMRIAMRNEVNQQEIKDTLAVDNALYSDSINKTIAMMAQGDFLKKTIIKDQNGVVRDVRLEKYRAMLSLNDDIVAVGRLTRRTYRGWPMRKKLVYVNTKDQAPWSDWDVAQLDEQNPVNSADVRLYLGQAATIRPCFNIDLGCMPDENLSVVGGTPAQRWELLVSVLHSCHRNGYKTIVFMAEQSTLMRNYADEIRAACRCVPGAELYESLEDWCWKLRELANYLDNKSSKQDMVCIFIGLETEAEYMQRIGNRSRGLRLPGVMIQNSPAHGSEATEFDVRELILQLFSQGGVQGIRCVTEISVFRNLNSFVKIGDYCKHKIAFNMSADDCLMYLGSSSFQKSIGNFAVYSDGSKTVSKLLPYKK